MVGVVRLLHCDPIIADVVLQMKGYWAEQVANIDQFPSYVADLYLECLETDGVHLGWLPFLSRPQ